VELLVGQPSAYLAGSDVVDLHHPDLRAAAEDLRARSGDDVDYARRAFHLVRDDVRHSWDAQDPTVTVRASEVLRERVGLCFGKAHLLAALLRAEGVPTGFCYQRLADGEGGFVLHGLVAVHLEGRWSRLDPRGNKLGVDAQFSLADERLAWPVRPELGEVDYASVLADPDEGVLTALRRSTDLVALCRTGLPAELPAG
jgi:transglutaminase-like putative cysteine protease